MSDLEKRYEQYACLRAAIEKNGDIEFFLVDFAKSAQLYTNTFSHRKDEIVKRLEKIIGDGHGDGDYSQIIEGIFPFTSSDDPYECDCALMHILEVILDVIEDFHH